MIVKSLSTDADLSCVHGLNGIVPKGLSNVKMMGYEVVQYCFSVSLIVSGQSCCLTASHSVFQ